MCFKTLNLIYFFSPAVGRDFPYTLYMIYMTIYVSNFNSEQEIFLAFQINQFV